MKAAQIRSQFLKFFESKGHTIVASSPVVPGDDPTLLFTNAGMNQFKDVFLGFDKRPYNRATTSQKCIRAGGKHNDLENVGYTARHHTFFEMLGNFSFGDYFKKEAIAYAWELLTEVYKLPAEKLWVTVYAEDDEAYDIWNKNIGVPAERIVRIGDNKGGRYASDNFWMMGDTGPCGPCTEIFYDHGPAVSGGPPGSANEDGDRYIEIWNNVFMQFNRTEDGVMHKLPKPSVDTGMGLERLTAVLQHVHSNYEIDTFVALLAAAKKAVDASGGAAANPDGGCDRSSPSLKVIADHIRACAFTVADGVIPGNEGRGYVLRRITRRAIRHGYKLGARKPFFFSMVATLADEMGEAYPELRRDRARVTEVLKQEEERFFQTIANGMEILEAALNSLPLPLGEGRGRSGAFEPHAASPQSGSGMQVGTRTASEGSGATKSPHPNPLPGGEGTRTLSGDVAFKLHDTYGFPLDLTADVCRERGVTVDSAGFDAAMTRQREQARAAGKFKMAQGLEYSGAATAFHGYEHLAHEGARVTALYIDGSPVKAAKAGDDVVVVLDHTPFYAESGGQVGDTGELRNAVTRVIVEDTTKVQAAVFGHQGRVVEGELKVGDVLNAKVDAERRAKTVRNHSATHLMHKALREVLGPHVQQKGSEVNADRTRFDFAHNAPMTDAQVRQVEALVNAEVLANAATIARVLPMEEAQKLGAMMLFGEKYGDEVRVLDIGSSRELCGGTHVQRSGDIGLFKIVAEGGVAAGVRRVEAVTGDNALAYLQGLEGTVNQLAGALKSAPAELPARLTQVLDQVRTLEKELAAVKGKLASSQGDELLAQAVDVGGIKVLAARLDGADAKALRETLDKLKDKLKSAVVVLATVEGGKVQLAAGVTADRISKLKAGELVNFVAQQVGGKGGGKADMAMAGGSEPGKLAEALASVKGWVVERA
ncbi:MAG: alanyl-tRNA synthetase [Methylibium sp. NZG]|nr:MAG: alanyl-tRNA synthetase [Methylibium sp. NZG]